MGSIQFISDKGILSSTDLLIAAFDSSDDAILVMDMDGIIRTWNHGAERLYGYSEADVVGRAALLLLPSDRTDEEADILTRIAAGERVQHFKTTRFRKDGTSICVSLTTSPVRLAGKIVGASHVAWRIAEPTLMEAATSQLAAIVESSEDAIISKNLDGIVLTWNASAERIYGYSADEMKWRPISLLLPADRPSEEREILERLKRGEHVDHFETVRMRKDGKPIEVSLTISPIRGSDGRIRGASHIARDISESKAFQARLLQSQKMEGIGILASGIAHDFNNLLTGILGGVSLAKSSLPPDHPAYSSLAIAEQSSETAAALTNQLLAYSGQGKFVVKRIDLSALIRDIVALLQASIPKSVDLQMALESDLPLIVADESQIQQVVMNLIINGAESIGAEGGSLRVSTARVPAEERAEGKTPTQVCVEVRDSGSGMTEATKARIFDPFFTTKVLGRGLGLAAVSGIVRAHQGTIQVESALGEGATFRVCLPVLAKLQEVLSVPEDVPALSGAGTFGKGL